MTDIVEPAKDVLLRELSTQDEAVMFNLSGLLPATGQWWTLERLRGALADGTLPDDVVRSLIAKLDELRRGAHEIANAQLTRPIAIGLIAKTRNALLAALKSYPENAPIDFPNLLKGKTIRATPREIAALIDVNSTKFTTEDLALKILAHVQALAAKK